MRMCVLTGACLVRIATTILNILLECSQVVNWPRIEGRLDSLDTGMDIVHKRLVFFEYLRGCEFVMNGRSREKSAV
jgi:hypothetical protein